MDLETLSLTNEIFAGLKNTLIQSFQDQIHLSAARDTEIYKLRTLTVQMKAAIQAYVGALSQVANTKVSGRGYMVFASHLPYVWNMLAASGENPKLVVDWNGNAGLRLGLLDMSQEFLNNSYPTLKNPAKIWNYPALGAYLRESAKSSSQDVFDASLGLKSFADPAVLSWAFVKPWLEGQFTGTIEKMAEEAYQLWVTVAVPAIKAYIDQGNRVMDLTRQLFLNQSTIDEVEEQMKPILDELNMNASDVYAQIRRQAEGGGSGAQVSATTVPQPAKKISPLLLLGVGALAVFGLKRK